MKTSLSIRSDSGEERRRAVHAPAAAQLKNAPAAFMPDARAASLVQRRHQERASDSSQTAQLKARADMMAGHNAEALVQRVEDDELLQGNFAVAQCEEDEDMLQGKFATMQRTKDEDLLQGKFSGLPIAQLEEKSNNTGLPNKLKAGIESLSGISMNHVQVHYNSDKPAQLNAHAYAQGREIHMAPGQEKHLPHEVWHVVQQMQGRVRPTVQASGVGINDDVGLEHEADVMGQKAATTVVQTRAQDEASGLRPGARKEALPTRATSAAAQRRGADATGSAVQRRVAVAQENKSDENDWVILSNLQYAKGLVGGAVSDLGAGSDYSDMGPDESLAVVGHGSAGHIQGFDAAAIAEAITRDKKAMPKTVPFVKLLACNAAKPTIPQDVNSSLVSQLAFILRRTKNYDTIVEGKPSFAQSSPASGMNATRPDKEVDHMAVEKPLIAKHELCFTSPPADLSAERAAWFMKQHNFDVSKAGNKRTACDWLAAKQKLKLVTEIMDEQGTDWKAMDLEARAAWIAEHTGPLYVELARDAKAAGTLFESGSGPGSGTTLAYGAAVLPL